ncbi:MAG TPA: hypothetical protein PKV71_01535 [Calditrichia bacterium]|nr:hypothetical protein [Calditrichota bacterium]HQU73078.1 hypothetical protein [Calditrichia bacterium]HQV30523.1 hypothetical protein [Calditrichia bacterium]
MPNRLPKLLLVLFGALLLPVPEHAADAPVQAGNDGIVVRGWVEDSTLTQDKPLLYTVVLSWPGPLNRFQVLRIPEPELVNLELTGSGSSNRLEEQPDGGLQSFKTLTFQLRPVHTGQALIREITISYSEGEPARSGSLTLPAVAVWIDPPSLTSRMSSSTTYVILLAIFGLTLLYFAIQYLRKRRSKPGETAQETLPLPEAFRKRLYQEIDPKSGNLNDAAQKLKALFLTFLAERYGAAPAPGELREKLAEAGADDKTICDSVKLMEKYELMEFGGARVDPATFQELYGIVEGIFLHQKLT